MGIYTQPPLARCYTLPTAKAVQRNTRSAQPWRSVAALAQSTAATWLPGITLDSPQLTKWSAPLPINGAAQAAWQMGAPLNVCNALAWGRALALPTEGYQSAWRFAFVLPTAADARLPWAQTFAADSKPQAVRWRMISHQFSPATYRSWDGYRSGRGYRSMRGQDAALDAFTLAPWAQPSKTDNASQLPWGLGSRLWPPMTEAVWPSDTSPPGTPPAEPSIEESYTMATDLTVTTFDPANPTAPGTPLKVGNVRLSLDIDSFAWALSCRVLDAASMALCLPPALVKVSTMGYDFVCLCERYTTTYAVGATWQLTGSSQTRQLDKPWSAPSSHLETNPISFKQACEACVSPVGFSIAWDAAVQDWTIPANGWSFNNQTPKAALAALLSAAGLVMIPDLATKTLHVQPRYKRAPWEYGDADADVIIAEAMMLSESGEFQPGDAMNGVWISGTTAAGVIVEVTRAGTAGDQLAPDQQHELITDVVAAAQWGKQIIAASGDKTLTTIETIITDETASPGLLLPGMIVEVQTALETWRGLILSCDLANPGSPRITQTVTIERSGEAAIT